MEKSYKILLPALGKSSRFKANGIFCDKMFLPTDDIWSNLVIDSVIKPFCNERFKIIIGVNTYQYSRMCQWLEQRTYNNIEIINLEKIQFYIDKKTIKTSDVLNSDLLKKLKIINKNSTMLKILGSGAIKDKINIEANLASKSAITKLEKVGGSIQLKK